MEELTFGMQDYSDVTWREIDNQLDACMSCDVSYIEDLDTSMLSAGNV